MNDTSTKTLLDQLIALADRAKDQPFEVQCELDRVFEQNPELKVAAERIMEGTQPEILSPEERSPEITLTAPSHTVAFVFDFDETLTEKNTAYPFVMDALDLSSEEIARRVAKFQEQNVHSGKVFEALVTERFHELAEEGRGLRKEDFAQYAQKFEPAPGLTGPDNFFDRMRDYAQERGLKLEFHIASANIENIPGNSVVAHEFDSIMGQRLVFNKETGFAEAIAEGVDFSTKPRMLSEISKGIVEESRTDHMLVNRELPVKIPLKNMVVVGDGETDVAFMAMAQCHGGAAFGVFNEAHPSENAKMLSEDRRPDHLLPRDYREGSALDLAFKSQIEHIAKRVNNEEAIFEKAQAGREKSSHATMPREEKTGESHTLQY